jgi:hypothetical protein
MIWAWLAVVCLCGGGHAFSDKADKSEIVLVIEFARHGSRTPLERFSWSADEDVKTLLSEGYDQHLAIGRYLNATYPHLLTNPE